MTVRSKYGNLLPPVFYKVLFLSRGLVNITLTDPFCFISSDDLDLSAPWPYLDYSKEDPFTGCSNPPVEAFSVQITEGWDKVLRRVDFNKMISWKDEKNLYIKNQFGTLSLPLSPFQGTQRDVAWVYLGMLPFIDDMMRIFDDKDEWYEVIQEGFVTSNGIISVGDIGIRGRIDANKLRKLLIFIEPPFIYASQSEDALSWHGVSRSGIKARIIF